MANGSQQQAGLDFSETFSPIVKQPTVKVVLSIALHHHWSLQQLDVSNAFLHGTLQEEVYMHQPKGFVDPLHSAYVCKLNKAFYSLKKAPRAWYSLLSQFLQSHGFHQS